ncbi:SLIT-ROBO Rho GTPase-activating protein 3-like isoform X2 [Liolophura sinensis]|uniref:SLIT-ROBO Rho GTPase-activating protein 3-like isoform X2 n=1 Tax=Liolophura sinensis TaxID=3198878 RepID=UPI0031597610
MASLAVDPKRDHHGHSTFSRSSSFRRSKRKQGPFMHIRQQLNEQLKCLDYKLETQCAMVQDIQEYFRRRADVESEYSKNLEKLVKTTTASCKAEKLRPEQFSTYTCWQHLLDITKKQSHDHGVLSSICNNQMVQRLNDIVDNSQRIVKKCREIGAESHDDIMQVLTSLQSAMRTYHVYQGESKQAEMKLQNVMGQKQKIEQQLAGKGGTIRKLKSLERQIEKKQAKYSENKLKALKARNDYLLSIEAANAAINKYFSDDLSDLMDCMDFGYHNSVGRAMLMYLSVHEELKNSHQMAIDLLNKCITDLDSRADKQKFMEINNAVFMLPRKFEFQPCRGDEVKQICAQKSVQEQLIQEYNAIGDRQLQLKLENDEIWKTLETAENTLMDMINVRDYEVSNFFRDDNIPPKSPHEAAKKRSDKMETESFYLLKFKDYTLSCNRLARLQAKCSAIAKALGESKVSPTGARPPSLPPNKPKKRRIGRAPLVGQPKLFGGSLEEYLEATGTEIPLVMKSCIRIINLYGMHHQGIFRVSGAQVEINDFRNSFEKGDDPLHEMVDASDINSVAGVLKLYFRELREPLFPLHLFDELISCSKLEDNQERLDKLKELINTLPRPIIVVLRYLFAFLNHLTEYSDENMMDPYNLAICFGPTLLPIPPDRDQVTYQSNVNEVIKTIIKNQDELFPQDGGEKYEKFILETREEEVDDHDEDNSSIPSDDGEFVFISLVRINCNSLHVCLYLCWKLAIAINEHNSVPHTCS